MGQSARDRRTLVRSMAPSDEINGMVSGGSRGQSPDLTLRLARS